MFLENIIRITSNKYVSRIREVHFFDPGFRLSLEARSDNPLSLCIYLHYMEISPESARNPSAIKAIF